VENAGGLGRHLARSLATADEFVRDVRPKLSVRVRVLSTGNARKNVGLDTLATALAASRDEWLATVDHETGSEVLRLLFERREDLVAERILRGIRPWGASSRLRRRLASEVLRDVGTLDRKVADLNERIEVEIEASGTTLTEIFGVGPILAARIIGTGLATWRASRPRPTSPPTPVRAGGGLESGEVVRHRLSLAGNRNLNLRPAHGRHLPSQVGRSGRDPLPQEARGGHIP
jgi:transposase